MEINPDLFDEVMQQYKQRKIEYVVVRSVIPSPLTFVVGNDNML